MGVNSPNEAIVVIGKTDKAQNQVRKVKQAIKIT